MTNKLKHATTKRNSFPVSTGVAKRHFRLPDPTKRRPATIHERQASSMNNRKVPITLPTLTCLKD